MAKDNPRKECLRRFGKVNEFRKLRRRKSSTIYHFARSLRVTPSLGGADAEDLKAAVGERSTA